MTNKYGTLYTNYYANIENSIGFKIAISFTLPDWIKYNNLKEWLFPLSPSIDNIKALKDGTMDQNTFIKLYKRKILFSKEYIDKIINYLKNGQDVTLLCYENNESFCHRLVLAEYITSTYPEIKHKII